MEIEIEFTNTMEAKLVIDGKELTIQSCGAVTKLVGTQSPETDNTLGGLIASEIFGTVRNIQQAWACLEGQQGTWDALDEDTAEEVSGKLWRNNTTI